jgi:hypothetical protein
MLGPARGAQLRVEQWPEGAPADLEVVRVTTGVQGSTGLDVAVGSTLANLALVNASSRNAEWKTPVDHQGVGMRLVGLYSAVVTGCSFQGFACALATGDEGSRTMQSYVTRVEGCRFQYCNQAVRLLPTANASVVRDCVIVWMHAPTSGPIAAISTGSSTGTVLLANNLAETCACWVYEIGATVNAWVQGGRLESVYGGVHVLGTGSLPAQGTQISGLSLDCDSLRFPAIWLERSAGALVTGVTFYQSRTSQPHVRNDATALRTVLLTVESDVPLRVVDPGGGVRHLG